MLRKMEMTWIEQALQRKMRRTQRGESTLLSMADVEVEYIRNPASAPSFASSSLSSYSTPSSSVDPAVMRQKAFETIQRVTPMIEKMMH